MNVTIEKLPKCVARASVTYTSQEVTQIREEIESAYCKNAVIPGFRPGKVPRRVVIKRYKNDLEQELNARFDQKLVNYLLKDEESVDVLRLGNTERDESEAGDMVVTIEMIVSPEFDLPNYIGIDIEEEVKEVTPEAVEGHVNVMRLKHSEYEIKEGPVEQGDVVEVSYSSECEGKPTREIIGGFLYNYTEAENTWTKVEESEDFFDFSKHVIGMVKGSEKSFAYTFPEDFRVEGLRGKTLDYTLTLNENRLEKKPSEEELELKLMGNQGGMRESIEQYLKSEKDNEVRENRIESLLDIIGKGLDFELPEEFLDAETQGQTQRILQYQMERGASREVLESEMNSIAEEGNRTASIVLKNHFILSKIAKEEEIKVEQNELIYKIYMDGVEKKMNPEEYLKKVKESGKEESYRESILLKKAADFLIEKANITEKVS